MSKIGRWNLELTEQANELGFETVQEALDNDYSVVGNQLTYDAEKGLESAHKAWEKEKEEVIKGLERLHAYLETSSRTQLLGAKYTEYAFIVQRAIKFVKEAHD